MSLCFKKQGCRSQSHPEPGFSGGAGAVFFRLRLLFLYSCSAVKYVFFTGTPGNLTLIVFWFLKDLKVTDLKSNNYRLLLLSKSRSKSRNRNRNLSGAGNVKKWAAPATLLKKKENIYFINIPRTFRSPKGSADWRSVSTLTPSLVQVMVGRGWPMDRHARLSPRLFSGSTTARTSSAGASQLGAAGGIAADWGCWPSASREAAATADGGFELCSSVWLSGTPLCRRRCLLTPPPTGDEGVLLPPTQLSVSRSSKNPSSRVQFRIFILEFEREGAAKNPGNVYGEFVGQVRSRQV